MANRKKILIIGNVSSATRVFRTELLSELVKQHSVYLISEFSKEEELQFISYLKRFRKVLDSIVDVKLK